MDLNISSRNEKMFEKASVNEIIAKLCRVLETRYFFTVFCDSPRTSFIILLLILRRSILITELLQMININP